MPRAATGACALLAAASRLAVLVPAAIVPIACRKRPPVVENREPVGGTGVTFFVAADTHCGAKDITALNRRQIAAMNALPGTAYPPAIGGAVGRPRGVLIAGDLTEDGLGRQWKQFVSDYGLTGRDGLLRYPVFEGTGNHDRHALLFRPVLDGVRKRHGGLTYSWDWADVHVVCLDECPRGVNLRWLREDLASVGRKIPVVIYFHFSILGPYSNSWSGRQKQAFGKQIEGYNVIAIFHGHYHGSGHYRWAGLDVYNVGSPRHSCRSFAVARITDTRMTVASWNWQQQRWQWWDVKPINESLRRAARPASAAAASR